MSYTLRLNNFSIITNAELSGPRKIKLVSAVLAARSYITDARMKTQEAFRCLQRPGVMIRHLPPRFLLHFRTLFRCDASDPDFLRALDRVARLLPVLEAGFYSPELRFKEYGMDLVSTIMNSIASLVATPIYQPTDAAYVRGFSLSKPGMYMGVDNVDHCANTGENTGNPNEIMLQLAHLDAVLENVIDTVIHEATHKFLGTEDAGMNSSSFNWMRDDGLAIYIRDNPGVPLPLHLPGFLSKTYVEAIANAYILTAYIMYMPAGDVTTRTELNLRLDANRADPTQNYLQAQIAARRPPVDDD